MCFSSGAGERHCVYGKTHLVQHYILERFEDNDWAVLEREDGEIFNIPITWLPEQTRAGDVLVATQDIGTSMAHLTFVLDAEQTKQRQDKIQALRGALPKGPAGDVEL